MESSLSTVGSLPNKTSMWEPVASRRQLGAVPKRPNDFSLNMKLHLSLSLIRSRATLAYCTKVPAKKLMITLSRDGATVMTTGTSEHVSQIWVPSMGVPLAGHTHSVLLITLLPRQVRQPSLLQLSHGYRQGLQSSFTVSS